VPIQRTQPSIPQKKSQLLSILTLLNLEWREWSGKTNPIESLIVFECPPSTCSIFDTLWQQRIMEAFGVLPMRRCFGKAHIRPDSPAAS